MIMSFNNLVIVESPNKCKKIESYLGSDYKVVASVGHIRDLPVKALGINIEDNFNLDYVYIPDMKFGDRTLDGGEKRIDRIKKLVMTNKPNKIYLATDDDREGEAIAWHIKECLGLDDTDFERITFNEITENALKSSIAASRGLLYDKIYAQEARRALDRLVGYLVSPVASEILGTPVSAGRVQSPAVLLVVLREEEIKKFKPVDHFGVKLSFKENWSANWITKSFTTEDNPYITDKDLAIEVANTKKVKVLDCVQKTEYSNAPSPFSTALLYQAASVSLGYSSGETAKLSQKLFEQGLISYHRTDSINLSEEVIAEVRSFAQENGYEVPEKPNKFKEKDQAQNAHEAIRPVDVSKKDQGTTEKEKALYNLIRERTIACQLAKAEYEATTLQLVSEDGKYTFTAKSRTLSKKGWLVFGDDCLNDAEQEDDQGLVPVLEKDVIIDVEKGEILAKKTQAPKRYTEASLIKKLESCGIGRPSTYASIMSNILGKGFLVEEKRMLRPSELGQKLIFSLLKANFSFLDLNYSKEMELELDRVEFGESNFTSVVSQLYTQLSNEIKTAKSFGVAKPAFPCPKCETGLKKFKNKTTGAFFWICQNDECKHAMDDQEGKPVERIIHSCPKCNERIRRFQNQTTKSFFWKCSNQECGHAMDDNKGLPEERKIYPCPKCSTALFRAKKATGEYIWVCPNKETDCKVFLSDANKKPVLEKFNCPKCSNELNRIKGENGYFWGCSNYKNGCKTSFDDKRGKPIFEAKSKVEK